MIAARWKTNPKMKLSLSILTIVNELPSNSTFPEVPKGVSRNTIKLANDNASAPQADFFPSAVSSRLPTTMIMPGIIAILAIIEILRLANEQSQ